MNTKFLIVFNCIWVSFWQSQTPTAFSLQEALSYAVVHSPSLQNAQLDERIAKSRAREITGLGLPQINGSIDFKDYLDLPTSLLPGDFFGKPGAYVPVKFGTKYNATAGFSFSQLLLSGEYLAGLQASKTFQELSKINTQRSMLDLEVAVSKAYYTVLVNAYRLKTFNANILRLQKILHDTRAYAEQGFVERIDAKRLEVQYNNVIAEHDKVQRLMQLSVELLKFQMGYPIGDSLKLKDSLNRFNTIHTVASPLGIEQRPDIKALNTQKHLQEIDVRRLRLGYMPSLAAYGAYQTNAQRNDFTFFDFEKNNPQKQWYTISLVGFSLNMPIFDGLQRHQKINQAQLNLQKIKNAQFLLEQAAQLELKTALIQFENARKSLEIQEQNIALAEDVFEVSQKKFNNGLGNNLELITAETSLKEAQNNYYNALYEYLIARTDIQKSTGISSLK